MHTISACAGSADLAHDTTATVEGHEATLTQPEGLDPLLRQVDAAPLREHFQRLHGAIARTVEGMPDHAAYLARMVANRGA